MGKSLCQSLVTPVVRFTVKASDPLFLLILSAAILSGCGRQPSNTPPAGVGTTNQSSQQTNSSRVAPPWLFSVDDLRRAPISGDLSPEDLGRLKHIIENDPGYGKDLNACILISLTQPTKPVKILDLDLEDIAKLLISRALVINETPSLWARECQSCLILKVATVEGDRKRDFILAKIREQDWQILSEGKVLH